uniref:Uncharacterized protein n=1 Tax=Anguilla anguilla TaxID=7936 RepID=A0A0E9W2Y3_ANGAN
MALSIEGGWKLWTLWMLCRHSIYSNNRNGWLFLALPPFFPPSFSLFMSCLLCRVESGM